VQRDDPASVHPPHGRAHAVHSAAIHNALHGAGRARTVRVSALAATVLALLLGALAAGELLARGSGASRLFAWLSFGFAACLAVALVLLLWRAFTYRARLEELASAAEISARTDPLTGLLNRATLEEHLVRAAAHARRRVEPLAALVLDVRRLCEVNERFGHDAGDELLRAFAACMRDALRADDVYGRIGEDEFLVLLPGTIRVQAEIVAERLRALAAEVRLPSLELPRGIELSIGCATAVDATADGILDAAHEDLRRTQAGPRACPLPAAPAVSTAPAVSAA